MAPKEKKPAAKNDVKKTVKVKSTATKDKPVKDLNQASPPQASVDFEAGIIFNK